MVELTKGGNVGVPQEPVTVLLQWAAGAGAPGVDVSALLLDANGRVASDADFVFFNQPTHPSGAVRRIGATINSDALEADLSRVPATVERVVVTASADGRPFSTVRDLRLLVRDAASATVVNFAIDAGVETALVAGELYRRAGAWKLRAVGQGYADGLAGLARDFGITVDDPGPGTAPGVPAKPPPSGQPAPTSRPRVDWLNPPVPAGYEF